MSEWNVGIVDEFRENAGVVGGMFEGKPLLILHHVGAKSGQERVCPLMYQVTDGGYAVFASKAGADSHPDWYYNLLANPDASVEVGTDTVAVSARVLSDDDRRPIWEQQKSDHPQFADYEAGTDRVIPVLVLETR